MSLEKTAAIEERISKVIELVKALKEEKGRLAEEVETLRAAREEAERLRQERDQVRERLERILREIEGLT